MLVYLKSPMSYTVLNGQRVYGRKFAYGSLGPTDIPVNIYKEQKNILEEAEYTKEWLDNKYTYDFPNISFKLSQLYLLDIDTLIKIAYGVGIVYIKPRKPSMQEKRTLYRTIRKVISRGVSSDTNR